MSGADPQIQASDPKASVFVMANAGSGKTSTLVKRVARLLLRGAAPDAILCVTYTKAAAAEMQRRLFGMLGDWAVMEDARLAGVLASRALLGASAANPAVQALWTKERRAFSETALIALAVEIVLNGLGHLAGTITSQTYSPGLVTGILIWLPLGIFTLRLAYRKARRQTFLFGLAVHADNAGHLGGALGGALVALLIPPTWMFRPRPPALLRGVACLGVAAVAASLLRLLIFWIQLETGM